MKLISAEFENFRILRDIEISFSNDKKMPLTVIRAENETGKTTLLRGLQWGLFGDKVLPYKGSNFRLHPLDWDTDKSNEVKICAKIEFEHEWKRSYLTGRKSSEVSKYLLIRTTRETIVSDNNYNREKSELLLFEETPEGNKPVPNPEDRLKQILGSNLKDLFFTDGDDALRFIEGKITPSTKRKLVKNAIRDMLSFEVIEESKRHVGDTIRKLRSETSKYSSTTESEKLAEAVSIFEEKIRKLDDAINEFDVQYRTAEGELRSAEKRLEEALVQGDKKELIARKNSLLSQEKVLCKDIDGINTEHAALFHSESIGVMLLKDKIENTYQLLEGLREQGKIPKASLPYLNELLDSGKCLCDTKLKKGDKPYIAIKSIIEDQEKFSDSDDRITELRIEALKKLDKHGDGNWIDQLKDIINRKDEKETLLENIQGQLKRIENEINAIPDSDIEFLRENKDAAQTARDSIFRLLERARFDHSEDEKDLKRANALYEGSLKEQGKAQALLLKLKVANDILLVLNNVYSDIEKEEIPKVSEKMNTFFLEMIRTDPKHKTLIQSSRINNDYDIEVFGLNNKELNPTSDLNGASRRALTLAFILALADVSEFIAPNVIDTPLGMMDPLIKESVLNTLVRESKQPILFLTRAEIRDIEDEIDKCCGSITTVISTAHYPKKLVNQPTGGPIRTIKCNCDHHQYCNICELIGDETDDRLTKIAN